MHRSGLATSSTALPTNTTAPLAASPTAEAVLEASSAPLPTATTASEPAPSVTPAACTSPAALTPALTEGPYFTPNSPEKTTLVEPEMSGTRLLLSGYVLTQDCRPVANATLDFWQANAEGQYDNSGYTLRGHLFTDANGRYQVETIVPGLYPGRTEHIHVKVQAPNGPILTTQLFMPGTPQNQEDNIYDPAMLMAIEENGDSLLATYNFVIATN